MWECSRFSVHKHDPLRHFGVSLSLFVVGNIAGRLYSFSEFCTARFTANRPTHNTLTHVEALGHRHIT